jgi:hypothetical protein
VRKESGDVKDRGVFGGLIGLSVVVAPSAWAATALPSLTTPITNFQIIFLAVAFLLGFAGFTTVVYGVARNRYGISWDEGVSLVAAGALAGGASTILGWVGLTAAAELPAVAPVVVDLVEMWL